MASKTMACEVLTFMRLAFWLDFTHLQTDFAYFVCMYVKCVHVCTVWCVCVLYCVLILFFHLIPIPILACLGPL